MILTQLAREFIARRQVRALQRAERRAARRAEAARLAARHAAPPKSERPRCGARCRDGHACNAPVVAWREGGVAILSRRCRMHGGASRGPKTEQGKRLALEALARGRARTVRGPGGRFVRTG